MKPLQLTICGWGPYKEAQVIDFRSFEERGLFLITGATGAGKTTVFDAIMYVLYGTMSGEVREKGSVRSDFAAAATPTYVELVMSHCGKEYRIYRNPEYLRPKKRKSTEATEYTKEKEKAVLILPDGTTREGSSEVNRRIQSLLCLDHRQFKQISMIAQGEFTRLLQASSVEKTKIFREIFDTQIYEKVAQELKNRSGALYREVSAYRHKMDEDIALYIPTQQKKNEFEELTRTGTYDYRAVMHYLKEESKSIEDGLLEAEKELQKKEDLVLQIHLYQDSMDHLHQLEKKLTDTEEWIRRLQAQREELRTFTEVNEEFEKAAERKRKMEELQINKEHNIVLCKQEEEKVNLLKSSYLKGEEEERRLKHDFEKNQMAYRHGIAGILAKELTDGEMCPVCGSLHHPLPAKCEENIPTKEQVEHLQRLCEAKQESVRLLHGELMAALSREEQLREHISDCDREQEILRKETTAYGEEVLTMLKKYSLVQFREKIRQTEQVFVLLAEKETYRDEVQKEYHKTQRECQKRCETFEKLLKENGEPFEKNPEKMLMEAEKIRQEARQAYTMQKTILERNRQIWESLHQKEQLLTKQMKQYSMVKELGDAANGNNKKRLVFEQYVLIFYFEQILQAANLRLRTMSGGRYELRRVQEIQDGRSKDSLDMEVLDYYTGKYRSVKTLSGGETFKVSLSLALGMSDVIQAGKGGIQVETLFIDEGFGTLDEESLDQACRVLHGLTETNRLIGIISHVPELSEKIADQIRVEKTRSGSKVHIMVS